MPAPNLQSLRLSLTAVESFRKFPRRVKVIDEVPVELTLQWAVRLYTLMTLAWDCIDSILDICIQMRLQPTKPLVRQIRQLKREYDQFRRHSIDAHFEQKENERMEQFLDTFQDDFKKLFYGIEFEVNKLDLRHDYKMLVIATQQALTAMDAVKIYARRCDKVIKEYGVWAEDCCLVQEQFLRLYPLIPQFAGDQYQPDLQARKLSASIIANRIESVEIISVPEDEA